MTATVLCGAEVVTPEAVLPIGWVLVSDGVITGVGSVEPDSGRPPADILAAASEVVDLPGRKVLPGFLDLHVHGGGGATFDDGGAAIRTGLAAHRAHGTTRSLVSLVTAPVADLTGALAAAAAAVAGDPTVLGLHLEGPFLNEVRRGAHNPAYLIDPDPGVLDAFLTAGAGLLRVITVAPELPGGLDLVRQITAAGVHAAVGHSDAEYRIAVAAFEAGADLVTHAFNGMRPLHHRDPAIIGAAMDAAGVVLEVINDGVHVHEAVVRLLRAVAPGRLALITDAMGAAAASDGMYRLAGYDVRVQDGVARMVDGGSIAGSTLTMDVAVRRAVLDVGMPLVDAVNAASLVPARFLGVDDRYGAVAPGRVADLVVTGAGLEVRAVMTGGVWVDDRHP